MSGPSKTYSKAKGSQQRLGIGVGTTQMVAPNTRGGGVESVLLRTIENEDVWHVELPTGTTECKSLCAHGVGASFIGEPWATFDPL